MYPAHGGGQIVSIEEQEDAGAKLELFVISFINNKMTLRVPTAVKFLRTPDDAPQGKCLHHPA